MFEMRVDQDSTVYITGSLLIQDAEEFYTKMKELLNKDAPTSFDLSGLEAIDVSNLQIFLSYKKSIPEESQFSICNASEKVVETMKLIGFAKPLQYTG
jgi:anti-anti-sigma regulatory factor